MPTYKPELEQLESRDLPAATINGLVYHWDNVTGYWTQESNGPHCRPLVAVQLTHWSGGLDWDYHAWIDGD